MKRLRPAEFARYDYGRENYARLLWFFEGFTSYYDDLLLRRAELIDDAAYLRLVNKTINQVQQTPGRQVQSVADASFDAWVKYYRQDEQTPNGTVSYYTKGALVALCLDLKLRAEGRATLDDAMRHLWNASGGGPGERGRHRGRARGCRRPLVRGRARGLGAFDRRAAAVRAAAPARRDHARRSSQPAQTLGLRVAERRQRAGRSGAARRRGREGRLRGRRRMDRHRAAGRGTQARAEGPAHRPARRSRALPRRGQALHRAGRARPQAGEAAAGAAHGRHDWRLLAQDTGRVSKWLAPVAIAATKA